MLNSAGEGIAPGRFAHPFRGHLVAFPQLLPGRWGHRSFRIPWQRGMPFLPGRDATALASVLHLDLERRSRNSSLRGRELRFATRTHRHLQTGAVFVHSALICAGCCLRQLGHPQISHRTAPGERRPLGLGGMFPRCRLLSWFLHPCVELCPGFRSPLSALGADSARIGIGPLHG